MQRILVTGGAGFIGSHTVDFLLSQNKKVIVLDDLSSGTLDNLDLHHPHLEFLQGNVLDYAYLEELVARCDAVLHLAAIVSVPKSLENPILSFQVNTQGVLHLLQAIYQSGKDIRFVFASSAAVYGNVASLPCREDASLSRIPLSPYALQKLYAEDYANLYSRLYGIKSLVLRYFNVYGTRQDAQSPYSGVINRFLEAYKKNETLTVFGDGQQSRDFIHVYDVAKANGLALESDIAGVFNIATGKSHTLLELIGCIEAVGQKKASLRFVPERQGDIKFSYASSQLAQDKLGFAHSISMREGIKFSLTSESKMAV